ncbi:hypothetical protein QFZ41_001950 [Luteibacter sp. W1I16]
MDSGSSVVPLSQGNKENVINTTKLVNVALALAPLGWLLAFYGVMSQLGDPAPMASRSFIESHRHTSIIILLIGVMCLVASLWLSGLSFTLARKRSMLVASFIVIPTIAIITELY